MNEHESHCVRHAMFVLREFAHDRTGKPGRCLQLALRVLAGHMKLHQLELFWRIATEHSSLQRRAKLIPLYDAIRDTIYR